MEERPELRPDIELAAVCGLFCPACSIYIASTEEPERLRALAGRFHAPAQEMECHGCRSDKRGIYCEKLCKMRPCAAAKGVSFCAECTEYPCGELKAFQAQMPHRLELWHSLEQIKREGYEVWYAAMARRYSCPQCGTVNSAYDLACRTCGAEPSCAFVARHGEAVKALVEKMGPGS